MQANSVRKHLFLSLTRSVNIDCPRAGKYRASNARIYNPYVIPKRTQSRLTLRSCVVFVITPAYIKNNHILGVFADYKHNK